MASDENSTDLSDPVSVRFKKDILEEIERLAKKDGRNRSNMIIRLVFEAMEIRARASEVPSP